MNNARVFWQRLPELSIRQESDAQRIVQIAHAGENLAEEAGYPSMRLELVDNTINYYFHHKVLSSTWDCKAFNKNSFD